MLDVYHADNLFLLKISVIIFRSIKHIFILHRVKRRKAKDKRNESTGKEMKPGGDIQNQMITTYI